MKKIRSLFAWAAVLGLVSCNDMAEERVEMGKVEVQFTTEIVSRALNNLWEEEDEIGIYMYKYNSELSDASLFDRSSNCKYIASADGSLTPATEMDKLYYPKSGNVNFIAYYPFDNVEDYVVKMDMSNQANPAEIDFLYSNNLVNVTGVVNSTQLLKFKHQMSKVVFKISAGYGVNTEDLEGLTVTVRNAASDASVSLVDGSVTAGKKRQDIKAVTIGSTTDATYGTIVQAEAIVVPQACDNVMIVVALTTGRNFFYNLTNNGYKWESGNRYSYEINLADQTVNAALNAEISDWTDGVSGGVESVAAQPWDGATVNTSWYSPELTTMTLYQPGDLAGLAKLVNEGNNFEGKTIHLSGDLDMNNKAWTPIGLTDNVPFKGTFVGNNHQVKNLNPTLIGKNDVVGLFGVSSGTISRLAVSGNYNAMCDKVTKMSVGGICAVNYGTISNCRNYAEIVAHMAMVSTEQTNIYVGGIVGQNDNVLSDCQNYGGISAENVNTTDAAYLHVGGIAGGNTGALANCENTRTLTGSNGNVRIGGIVGISSTLENAESPASIENCSNIGDVIIETSHGVAMAGGIVGRNADGSTVTSAFNKGNVEAAMATGTRLCGGGIIGMNDASFLVSGENKGDVSVAGAVDADPEDEERTAAIAGGAVGYNLNASTIHQTVNSGNATATLSADCYAGGITGFNATEQGEAAYTYGCCTNSGSPLGLVGNATADNTLITEENESAHASE